MNLQAKRINIISSTIKSAKKKVNKKIKKAEQAIINRNKMAKDV
jgi:hypothetical protein